MILSDASNENFSTVGLMTKVDVVILSVNDTMPILSTNVPFI